MSDLRNHIVGGMLMGFGGVTALGCTIGQGISGFSTLALGSIVTFLAIIAGSAATMKYQVPGGSCRKRERTRWFARPFI